MSILIKKANILTQNKKREKLKGDIYIEDNEITEISKKSISTEADFRINGTKKLVIPGLINTHTHIPANYTLCTAKPRGRCRRPLCEFDLEPSNR